MATVDDINTKLTEFKTSLDDSKTALKSKGVSVSTLTADSLATNINSITTTKSMGSKSVTFKQNAIVYGFKVTESESEPTKRVSYLDNAKGMVALYNDLTTGECNYGTWKDSWIFKKVYPVMLKTSGSLGYKLNTEDQTKRTTGAVSDINDSTYDGNAMVCIEKFYTKFSMNGNDCEIRISDTKLDGYEAIGFIRENGTEASKIYISMFGGVIIDTKLRSIGNQDYTTPSTTSRASYVGLAENNGTGYGIHSYAMNTAFSILINLLIKSFDMKSKLGLGKKHIIGDKTGTSVKTGAFSYDTSSNRVKALWVEDYIGQQGNGVIWYEVGVLSANRKVYIKMKPPYDLKSTEGYTEIPDCIGSTGYISAMKCSNEYGRYPIAIDGTLTTNDCAYWNPNDSTALIPSKRECATGFWGRIITNTSSINNTAGLTYLPPK